MNADTKVAEAVAVATQAAVEEAETYPAGFEPGRGSAYDYIPSWMHIPPLYSGEKQDDPLVVVKLFTPDSNWTWYITEYDGEDTCFGLVVGFETELGYFSISEIAEAKGPLGLRIERDLWFRPTPVTQLAEYQAEWGEHGGPYEGARPDPDTPEAAEEVLTRAEAAAILDREMGRDVNPAQTLSVGMLHALERVAKARVVDAGDGPREVPRGAARIGFFAGLDGVPDGVIWTADLLTYQKDGGEQALRTTCEYLRAVAACFAELGFRVHQVAKDYDQGTYVYLDRGDGGQLPDPGAFSCEIAPWGKRKLSLHPAREWSVSRSLEALLANCYAEPDVPEGWRVPGLHLAKRIRTLLREAYAAVEASRGSVLWDDLWAQYAALAEADGVLRWAEQRTAPWSPAHWIESLGLEVIRPASWSYVPAGERQGKLSQVLEGDPQALREALEGRPSGKRLDLLLSALADTGAPLPPGYVAAERAGKPGGAMEASGPEAEPGESVLALAVDAETLGKAGATYSAQMIANSNRIKRPFALAGVEGLWVCTGRYGDEKLKCHQVIPAEDYEGETNTDVCYEGRAVTYCKKPYVLSDRQLWLALDESAPEAAEQEAGTGAICPDEPAAAEAAPKPKAKTALPDGIPAAIEVDLGRLKGWGRATALAVKGKWLHYRLEGGENGDGEGKVQLIGRDIVWREATERGP